MAMTFFVAGPVWTWIYAQRVSSRVFESTKLRVEKYPQLQPAWEIAMQDGVLTISEAKVMADSVGEDLGPEQ